MNFLNWSGFSADAISNVSVIPIRPSHEIGKTSNESPELRRLGALLTRSIFSKVSFGN